MRVAILFIKSHSLHKARQDGEVTDLVIRICREVYLRRLVLNFRKRAKVYDTSSRRDDML